MPTSGVFRQIQAYSGSCNPGSVRHVHVYCGMFRSLFRPYSGIFRTLTCLSTKALVLAYSGIFTIVHGLEPKKVGVMAPMGGQKIRQVFSNVRVCTFQESVMSCLSFWPKIEVFYRPEWTKGGTT